MKKRQLFIFILSVLILVIFNNVFLKTFTKTNSYFLKQELINNEEVSAQRLFDRTWRVISKDYYEPDFNHQNWNRWKTRYQDKIQTFDDAIAKNPGARPLFHSDRGFQYTSKVFRENLEKPGEL